MPGKKEGLTYSGEILFYGSRRTDKQTAEEETYPALGKKVLVPTKIGGYFLLNAKVRQELGQNRAVTLSIQNLLDEEYENLLFYPGPGRWISVGFEQEF